MVEEEKNVREVKAAEPAASAGAGDRDKADRTGRPARAQKSEQTRTLILETALRLFEERGYDRTTMRAIAKEAGVSVGNAYYYFSSKEELLKSNRGATTCPTCHGAGVVLQPPAEHA